MRQGNKLHPLGILKDLDSYSYRKILEYVDVNTLLSLDRTCQATRQYNQSLIWPVKPDNKTTYATLKLTQRISNNFVIQIKKIVEQKLQELLTNLRTQFQSLESSREDHKLRPITDVGSNYTYNFLFHIQHKFMLICNTSFYGEYSTIYKQIEILESSLATLSYINSNEKLLSLLDNMLKEPMLVVHPKAGFENYFVKSNAHKAITELKDEALTKINNKHLLPDILTNIINRKCGS